ncbi:transmembrane protein 26-like [Myxocyprinus asiaticus]|uniref:transmembrane protein 26-like n=1 Tax=Myxocyprinus asiaticus TaxID=70543 RepID=UPI002222783E|nr:transmembrane protein 26-like [Myxocyprinus asiaticus]
MLFKFTCAVVTRLLFILVSLIGVWRVTWVKNNSLYWFLTILYLPLVAEMILTLRRRKGKDYKWFSPAILFFLISIIPTIWILELHHQQNRTNDTKCNKLDSSMSIKVFLDEWRNLTNGTANPQDPLKLLTSVCANDWILALHQILLILLIVGKWLLPIAGGVTRDEMSQLLLIFVGIAADILEFISETLSDVKENNPQFVYIVLSVWTWSMLQFPLHFSVVNTKPEDFCEGQGDSLLSKHRTDIWNIVETLFLQDGPFFIVRLTVMMLFSVYHQMLVFFTIKNFLVVMLNIYRLWVICIDYK